MISPRKQSSMHLQQGPKYLLCSVAQVWFNGMQVA